MFGVCVTGVYLVGVKIKHQITDCSVGVGVKHQVTDCSVCVRHVWA